MQIMRHTIKTALYTAAVTLCAVSFPIIANAAANPTTPSFAAMPTQGFQTPADAEVVALADRTMRIFMTSVREKSMHKFWEHISLQFQKEYSALQLDAVFKDFYDIQITGDPLAGRSPIFKARPKIDENDYLVVEGFYATRPSRLVFHLTYVKEGLSWKVIHINVSVKPIAPPAS